MSIPETISFDKTGEVERGPSLVRKLFLSLVIILVAVLSFGIGRLTSAPAGQGIRIEMDPTFPILNFQFLNKPRLPYPKSQLPLKILN
jgi:hypothetical protein